MSFRVYKSSAGSGKTFTLVKEYLKLALSDEANPPQRYRQILAVTFTNKAATEMKERMLRALEELAEPKKGKPDVLAALLIEELQIDPFVLADRAKLVLRAILHHYTDFAIGTIDSFVHRIVRAFAFDLHLPMNFEVETDADKLLRHAVDLLISRIGTDEQLTDALIQFAESRTDEDRSWQIEQELLAQARQLLDETGSAQADRLRHLNIADFMKFRDTLKKTSSDFLKKLEVLGQTGLDAINAAGLGDDVFYYGAQGVRNWFSKIAESNDKVFAEPNTRVLAAFHQDKWYGGKASAADKMAIDGLKPLLTSLWEKLQTLRETEYGRFVVHRLLLRNIYALAVLNELEKQLFAFRTEENVLHISEFNRIISQIVFNEPVPFIYERLGEKYSHYLIDEFQDTSVLQWQNLLPLLENALASENFTMLVGDGKQAIYRWRGGEVEQFARLPEIAGAEKNELLFDRQESLKRNYEPRRLNRNFRSKTEIIDFNNRFFRELSNLLDAQYRSIYDELEQESNPQNTGGFVQIELNESPRETVKEEYVRMTIARVQSLVAEGFRQSDIAILTRTNKEGSLLAQGLIDAGLSVISSESLLLKQSPCVQLVLATLRWIDHTYDAVARAQIIQGLVALKKISGAFETNLQQCTAHEYGLPGFLRDCGIRFNTQVLARMTLYQRCESILQRFQLDRAADPYLVFFLDEVLAFSSGRNHGPDDFLNWWQDRAGKASVVIPDGMNAVRVMTIHKSKGLEFPVVILPFADWDISTGRKQLWVELQDESLPHLPTGIVNVSEILLHTEYASHYLDEKNKSLLDHLNVLYVALTRAERRLYIMTKPSAKAEGAANLSDWFARGAKALGMIFENNMASFGLAGVVELHTKHALPFVSSEHSGSTDWTERLSIRSHAADIWATDEKGTSRDRGKLIHAILARVRVADDLERAVAAAVSEGWVDKHEAFLIEVHLKNLLQVPEVAAFFQEADEIRTEAEILLPDGGRRRPDRVVRRGERTLLIDFKTGREAASHHRQLKKYAQLLHEMGYSKIEKWLIYTEEMRVEAVE